MATIVWLLPTTLLLPIFAFANNELLLEQRAIVASEAKQRRSNMMISIKNFSQLFSFRHQHDDSCCSDGQAVGYSLWRSARCAYNYCYQQKMEGVHRAKHYYAKKNVWAVCVCYCSGVPTLRSSFPPPFSNLRLYLWITPYTTVQNMILFHWRCHRNAYFSISP